MVMENGVKKMLNYLDCFCNQLLTKLKRLIEYFKCIYVTQLYMVDSLYDIKFNHMMLIKMKKYLYNNFRDFNLLLL